ncbi:MAG TPA: hypothetical protein VFH03_01525 [Actinoplanes sp.]|nr:hypothetical protein [Actinoplanes sp.]
MYAWIWRKLPFGLPGKITGSIVLISTVGVLLWYVVFPWATPLLPFDDVQVGTGTEQVGDPAGQDPAEQNPDAVIPGEEGAPDEIPYSVESNAPHPSATATR